MDQKDRATFDNEFRKYNAAIGRVMAALKRNSEDVVINKALEGLVKTWTRQRSEHVSWVISLVCHPTLTEELWKRRMLPWIKRLNEIAFKGALEFRDDYCCDQLIWHFATRSIWSDAAEDVGITPENTDWMSPNRCNAFMRERDDYVRARIDAGRFVSEAAYITWKLRLPGTWLDRYWSISTSRGDYTYMVVQVQEVQELLAKLTRLGGDVAEFDGRLVATVREQLAKNKFALEQLTFALNIWFIHDIERSTEELCAQLAALETTPSIVK